MRTKNYSIMRIGHWDSPFTEIEILKSAGFVYEITNLRTGQKYIGRKYVWRKGRRINRKWSRVESDWRSYMSSSDDLKADINRLGLGAFSFRIMSVHKSRADVNYEEIRQLYVHDVLRAKLPGGGWMFYNKAIQSMTRYRRS